MNLFTNEEKNDKMKKEEYLTADKSNSSTPTGISRFLYETPEKQQNTVSHNFSYNPQKPQSIKTISADRTANSLNKNTFKQPVNSFNNVKPPKSIKAEDITEDLEKERIFKATKRIAKNLPEDKLNEVYKLKEKRPDDYYNLTDNSREDYKRMKDLFSPRVQFSVSNYENNYDMMNKDEKIMLTSNAQNYFNKLGYTDKNGNYLEEDGIWGPKTQKVFERYKKDTGYVSPKNNNVDKAYTLAKDLKEDIYNPETLIASPENLRSDVSLYGKSPADMNKKYSYENGELKVTMDNDYPLIAKANSFKYDTNNFNSLHDRIKSSNNTNMLDKLKEKENKAKAVIQTNKHHILNAANKHGVNPGILASTIYAEQARNVNLIDDFDIYRAHKDDVSLGIGQIKISTAMLIEDAGYMEKTVPQKNVNGEIISNRRKEIINKLTDPAKNIEYAAAYLSMIRDLWKDAYPEIGGRTAIMATLYNIGANGSKGPHSNPQSNDFGDFAKKHYYDMLEILNN